MLTVDPVNGNAFPPSSVSILLRGDGEARRVSVLKLNESLSTTSSNVKLRRPASRSMATESRFGLISSGVTLSATMALSKVIPAS